MEKQKTIIYIDSWNVYYNYIRFTKYRWIDIQRYCQLWRNNEEIVKIYYFTARVKNSEDVIIKQELYLRALSTLEKVEVICGSFASREINCQVKKCDYLGYRSFKKTVEKQTDVNIATMMISNAFNDKCNIHVLISSDTDLIPAIKEIKRNRKDQRVIACFPLVGKKNDIQTRNRYSNELAQTADKSLFLPYAIFEHSIFPDPVINNHTGEKISKPEGWANYK